MHKNKLISFTFIFFASIVLLLTIINVKQLTINHKDRPYDLSKFYIKFDTKEDLTTFPLLYDMIMDHEKITVIATFKDRVGVYDPLLHFEPYPLWRGEYFNSVSFNGNEKKELQYIDESLFTNTSELSIGSYDDYYILNRTGVDLIYNYNSDLKVAKTYYIDFIDQKSRDRFISSIEKENIVKGRVEVDTYRVLDYFATLFTNKEALIYGFISFLVILNTILFMRNVYIRQKQKIVLTNKLGIHPLTYFYAQMKQQFAITVVACGGAFITISLLLNVLHYDILLSYPDLLILLISVTILFSICATIASVLVFLQKGDA